MESTQEERVMGIRVDSKLNVSQQHALAAKRVTHVLGCIRQGIAHWSREGIVLLCAGAASPPILCAVLDATI